MNTLISSLALIAALAALIVGALYRKKIQAQHGRLMSDYKPVGILKKEVSTLSQTYSDLQL